MGGLEEGVGSREVFLLGVFEDSLQKGSSREAKDTGGRRNDCLSGGVKGWKPGAS